VTRLVSPTPPPQGRDNDVVIRLLADDPVAYQSRGSLAQWGQWQALRLYARPISMGARSLQRCCVTTDLVVALP
jgi:hypothetical protein